MSIINLIRPELRNSSNYVPGGDQAQFRLHANELPWSPLLDDEGLNYYPSNQRLKRLTEQLSEVYQVAADELVVTRGSDDGIDLINRLFLTAGQDAVMIFPPTFPMYAFYAQLQQAQLIQCPLRTDDFSLSLEQIKTAWQPNCKLIMICSPNNPTANLFDLQFIASVCREFANKSMIVVDEAYIEFAETESATTLIKQFDNLMVLRTLSKAYGMAGLRLGSVIAQEPVIGALKKIIAPYIIPTPVINLATKALQNSARLKFSLERVVDARQNLLNQLSQNPLVETLYPTATNFILLKTKYAESLTSFLATRGIAIRDFPPQSVLNAHLRVTVGNEEENQLLLDALAAFTQSVVGLNDAKNLIY